MKVSMDGAPYLRKIDLTIYKSYTELVKALENMFKFNLGKKKSLAINKAKGFESSCNLTNK